MAVSKRVAMVLKGVSDLNETERSDFIQKVNELLSNDYSKTSVLKEEISRTLSITLGPVPQSCPCCGR